MTLMGWLGHNQPQDKQNKNPPRKIGFLQILPESFGDRIFNPMFLPTNQSSALNWALTNNVDTYQTIQNAASDLGMHCLSW